MNANIKTFFSLMFIAIAICSCVNESDNDNSGNATDNQIRVLPQIGNSRTRSGWNNSNLEQNNQQFGLFIYPESETPQPKSTYNNVRMVYKNNAWNDYDPNDADATSPLKQMYWANKILNVQVTAYLPYRADISSLTTFNGKIGTEQNEHSQGESINKNDLLYFQGLVNPTATENKTDANGNIIEYKLVDGKITIPFRHSASKLNLKIKIGTSFNLISPGTAINPITDLKVNGTVCDYIFDLTTGKLTNSTGAATTSVNPWCNATAYVAGETYLRKAEAYYECILIPQTVAANAFSISLNLGGKKYEWLSEMPVSLLEGKQHNLTLNVGENAISLTDFTIDDWGIANVPIEPDLSTPVTLNTELCSTDEEVTLSVVDKNVHFTNQGGKATLVFTGDYDKSFEIIDADPRLTILANTNEEYKNSSFSLSAVVNSTEEAYTVRLRVYNPLLTTNRGCEVTINADAYMPYVEMGGLTWMAFNGVGKETALYYYPRMTTRDVYKKDWFKFAVTSMWGPRATISPMLLPQKWTQTFNNNELTNADTPDWTAEYTNIPCPVGWRLPTYEEYGNIWPSNDVSIPATYTRNNVTYTATIIDSKATPYELDIYGWIYTNLLVISDGKDELLFPMSGWRPRIDRSPNLESNLPATDGGKCFYMWTQDHGLKDWNAKIVGINSNSKSYYNTDDTNQALAESYQSVRCVKNK